MLVARAADENFSKTVRAEDFSAAGLAKLSPEELGRLDALVRDYKSGASAAAEVMADRLAAAKRETAMAEAARATAEAKVAQAEAAATAAQVLVAKEKKSDGGLLQKAKVMLTPGTTVEYAATESRIAGNFTGWAGRTILTLENGERWQVVANSDPYDSPARPNPKATIRPAAFGGFWLEVEGVNARVRVTKVGSGK